jgi:dienelactone hydrolase
VSKKMASDLNVWNYKDQYYQHDQLRRFFTQQIKTQFLAVVRLATKKIVFLNKEGEKASRLEKFENYVLFEHNNSHAAKDYYNYELISTIDGTRIPITKTLIDAVKSASLSPDDRFFIWFDYPSHQYLSLDLLTGKKITISDSVPVPLHNLDSPMSSFSAQPAYGIMGWNPRLHSVFVYDKYDIWQLDLTGNIAPVDITNGYGRKSNTVFGLNTVDNAYNTGEKPFEPKEPFLLTGFNLTNKFNGFWLLNNNKLLGDPTKLTMGAFHYTNSRGCDFPFDVTQMNVLKSKNTNHYLVERQTASEFPNIYLTSDFKSYKPLSDLHPEKAVNWLTSELMTWKMFDGDMGQGVLYKPENFDSTKRYPVILYYYSKMSDILFGYEKPGWSGAAIDIPYYVSNGYLVFLPDIYPKPNRKGQSILNSVVSAAHYLARLPYIDSSKMGIQGHSWGGYETNYLVTHSNCFAAACTAAGISDQIGGFNGIEEFGATREPADYLQKTNGNIMPYGPNITPSKRPDLFEDNSPVLAVQNVTTPLLIIHGDKDSVVPFPQAIEMYLSMLDADKKVWLLEYENGGHIQQGDDAKDVGVRMKQFFDYYLKGAPPPVWMTRGVSAALKGITSGLEYDNSGAKP